MDNLNENVEEIVETVEENATELEENVEEIASEEIEVEEGQEEVLEAVKLESADTDANFEEVTENEVKDVPLVQLNLTVLNRYQLMLLMNSLKLLGLVEKTFYLMTKPEYIREVDENNQVKSIYNNAELLIAKPNEENADQLIVCDIIDSELAIKDGNGMDISIRPFDQVYIKDITRDITFKAMVTGYGFNEEEQDVEIDLIISYNGRLDIARYMYSDENSKLFTRGTNIAAKAIEFIKALEE